MSFCNYKYINNVFSSGNVYFYIICHKTLIQTDYGHRYDYILNELDTMFNREIGIGAFNLTLESAGDLPINENYFGATVVYKFTAFQ
jgi:hypothetical protein